MLRCGSIGIVTADKDFDALAEEGIERLDPARVEGWRGAIVGRAP